MIIITLLIFKTMHYVSLIHKEIVLLLCSRLAMFDFSFASELNFTQFFSFLLF